MPDLNWKLLTKKRGSSTQGLPPGKEHLAWVTNTVTLIYGERDAILVDTFLSEQHSMELIDWIAVLKKAGVAEVKLDRALPFLGTLLKKEQDVALYADQLAGGKKYRS